MNYIDDCGTPTADLLTVQLLLNSIVSTAGAEFMTIDIKHFYLNTPLKRYKYFRLGIADLPDNIVEQYKLQENATKAGFIYLSCLSCAWGGEGLFLHKASPCGRGSLETLERTNGRFRASTTSTSFSELCCSISIVICN